MNRSNSNQEGDLTVLSASAIMLSRGGASRVAGSSVSLLACSPYPVCSFVNRLI